MRALQIAEFGADPTLVETALPEPGPGEVRVRIAACGLNFADLLMAEGRYQERPDPPVTLGMELAGTVEALGPGVDDALRGRRVAVFAGSGGLAETGVFPAERCVPLPDAMPLADAAAFQVAYGTSHVALDHKAGLAPGETLLVLGAAGGVGLTAVEIGKRMGARVIAVARGAERLAVARAAGADHLIDSDTADLRAEVKALGGADVVYDPVGGDVFTAAMRACRPEARILVIGFASGDVPQIKANHLLVKNLTVMGLYWGGYLAFRPEVLTGSLATLFGWYAEGGLSPHVSHVLPLERALDGLELLRARKATGKVVIEMGAATAG
ncbi:NADPH2:quinone reductase [Rhodovulum sp. ES.010]|uniref:NADPH:quinone oxidoreductase family protein n=1 Tax=Rhodovulum sp. ES.010 TaxID=1882821 RepID=UPI00092803C5|nr:NADPH:quinone oxidoreductase family protein [Rhodovulum sp. ES.010]SIO56656.1 NADPH2:quinone reductase [Rhodovulum sp. ES.010]